MNPRGAELRTVTWRTGGAIAGESLWSIAHKFCSLNHATASGFMCCFGIRRRMPLPDPVCVGASTGRPDLRFAESIDLRALFGALAIRDFAIEDSTVRGWGRRHEVRRATAGFLRFCPSCIEAGFHSVVFQFTSLRECPLHGDWLEDCCPKCGQRIPYRLPEGRAHPYSCACGRQLFWGVGRPDWPRMQEAEELTWLLGRVGSGLRLKFGGARASDYPAGLVWQQDGGLSADDWDRLLTKGAEASECTIGVASIWREWAPSIAVQSRRSIPPDSVYANLLEPDDGFGSRLYELFRRIDRALLRRMPVARRKRGIAKLGPWTFYLRDCGSWGREYIALRLWQTYWTNGTWGLAAKTQQRETTRQKRLHESRVFWRFLQHARVLRPQWRIDVVDEWVQLHFFGAVAFATYEAARKLVFGSNLWVHPFRTNRCWALERAVVPFFAISRRATRKPVFEIKVFYRNDVVRAHGPRTSRSDLPLAQG